MKSLRVRADQRPLRWSGVTVRAVATGRSVNCLVIGVSNGSRPDDGRRLGGGSTTLHHTVGGRNPAQGLLRALFCQASLPVYLLLVAVFHNVRFRAGRSRRTEFRAARAHNGAMTAITDVPGVRVGHASRTGEGWLSGVTVVLPPPGTVGSVDVRGGGPGTHETDALDPTTLSAAVDAVVLTGGSAVGLATAHGAQRWCEEQGRGFAVPGGVVPIVPAAAIFDLGRGGDFAARPDEDMG